MRKKGKKESKHRRLSAPDPNPNPLDGAPVAETNNQYESMNYLDAPPVPERVQLSVAVPDQRSRPAPPPGADGDAEPSSAPRSSFLDASVPAPPPGGPSEGKPRLYIDGARSLPSQFDSPWAIAVSPVDSSFYVTDVSRSRVVHFDRSGRLLGAFGSPGRDGGQLREPRGVAVSPQGLVVVSDTLNNRIQVFDADGRFVREFGGPAGDERPLQRPAGLHVHADGTLYVADQRNGVVQMRSLDGRFVDALGTPGSHVGQFRLPADVAVASGGDVIVADSGNGRLQAWRLGEHVRAIGAGRDEGVRLGAPVAVDVGAGGDIVVADQLSYSVHVLRDDGAVVRSFGRRGEGEGEFDQLAGVAYDPRHDEILVTDSYNRTIQIF